MLSVVVAARPLNADCPRTGGETSRRILPAVFLFPAGLLVLRHQQSHVPIPSAGARVRVSRSTPDGVQFTEGTFVAANDSAFQLAIDARDTISFARADTRCLQVYRRSRAIGAWFGLPVGFIAGTFAGFALGLTSGDPWVAASTSFLGAVVGVVAGPFIGSRRGASAWDVAWEHSQ
jgi:hypothetical protein